jgi:hypothetical protein
MRAPWFRLAAASRWAALRHLDDVCEGLRPFVLAHVEHLDRVLAELRERRAA